VQRYEASERCCFHVAQPVKHALERKHKVDTDGDVQEAHVLYFFLKLCRKHGGVEWFGPMVVPRAGGCCCAGSCSFN